MASIYARGIPELKKSMIILTEVGYVTDRQGVKVFVFWVALDKPTKYNDGKLWDYPHIYRITDFSC